VDTGANGPTTTDQLDDFNSGDLRNACPVGPTLSR
jgi:hypothetical protein